MPIAVPRQPVRVRIAPSPTGDPHVGTAYIGLFNMAFARHHGGSFVLRIEDTDQKRSTPESEVAILRSLRWCGLRWDEGPDVGGAFGPYRQSERSALYKGHADELIAAGRAYRCFCSAERLDRVRAEQRARRDNPRYDGRCRGLDPAQSAARAEAGEVHVVRLAFPRSGETLVPDALRGLVRFDNAQIDDQVLLKSDGLPTYHLANVVDDHHMEITHVIRAEEWLSSTPKHLALYEAFAWEAPVFVHMPLLRNADKSKISKRKNPTSLEYYQRSGYLPEAFLNFLGLLGYSLPDEREVFDLETFSDTLDLSRVSLGGPVFDRDKLAAINGRYIRSMTPAELASRTRNWVQEDGRDVAAAELVQERMTRFSGFMPASAFLFGDDLNYGPAVRYLLVGCGSKKKKSVRLDATASARFFTDVIARLEAAPVWTAEAIEAAMRAAVAAAEVTVGDGFMAIRVAISGGPASPPLFEGMAALGRSLTLDRLRRVARMLSTPNGVSAALAKTRSELEQVELALERAEAAQQAGGRLGPGNG